MHSNSLIKSGPLSRCKFRSVLGDYPSRWRKLKPRDQVRILNVRAFEDKFPDAAGRFKAIPSVKSLSHAAKAEFLPQLVAKIVQRSTFRETLYQYRSRGSGDSGKFDVDGRDCRRAASRAETYCPVRATNGSGSAVAVNSDNTVR